MKSILISLLFLCTSFWVDAQIKINRHYDYIGHEVNNAGLRVVGLKSEKRSDGYFYDSRDNQINEPMLYGCIDPEGNEVIHIFYKSIDLGKDKDYIHVVRPKFRWKKSDGSYSGWVEQEWLKTEDGRRAIGDTYSYLRILPDPLIFKRFKCSIAQAHGGKYCIINVDNSKMVSPVYDELQWINYEKGYLLANLGGYWGIIDYLGREIVPYQWNDIKRIDDVYLAVELNDLWGIFDNNGKEIIPIQFNKIGECRDNIAIIMSNDKYGAYDLKNRQQIIPFGKYYSILDFNGKTFWARVLKSNQYVMQLFSLDGTVLNDLSSIYKYINKTRDSKTRVGSRDDVKEVSIWDVRDRGEDEHWRQFYYDDLGREYSDFNLAKAANDEIRKADNVNIESLELASIIWHSGTEPVQDKEFNLVVSAQSQSDIQDVYLVVNGYTYKDFNINKISGLEMTISKEIPLNEGSNAIKVCVRNAAGTTQEEKMVVYRPQANGQTSIEWLAFDPTSVKNERLLKFGIKSKSKIEDVTVTVNGSQARGVKTVESDKYQMVMEQSVRLVEGANRIVVSLRNGDGITTKERIEYYGDITPKPVFNDKRIALIIGNSNYSKPEMKLKNPENDAKDIAKKLESLGFHVILKLDATLNEMNAALEEFELQASEYDVALFYFAGHGIQSH